MDFITHLPSSSGKTTILVVVDRLSKHAHFSALGPRFSAPQVAAIFLRDIVRLHGFPSSIISDRDPIFISTFWKELFHLHGTTLALSSAYHPQSDGQTEVLNRCLEQYLRCFVADEPSAWLKYLPWAEWHYNTSWHSVIRMSPYEAVFGRPPPSLLDYLVGTSSIAAVDDLLQSQTSLLQTLRDNLKRAQQRMQDQTNAKRHDMSFRRVIGCIFVSNLIGRPRWLTAKTTSSLAVFMGRFVLWLVSVLWPINSTYRRMPESTMFSMFPNLNGAMASHPHTLFRYQPSLSMASHYCSQLQS